jgi:hypothetical protein
MMKGSHGGNPAAACLLRSAEVQDMNKEVSFTGSINQFSGLLIATLDPDENVGIKYH